MSSLWAYLSMFTAALVAATILPAQSEAVLVSLLVGGQQPAWMLILVASVGNVLGSCVNWMLGRFAERYKKRRWFPANEQTLLRAQKWYGKYGRWSLLLSWVPIVGDPLTLAAGVMGERFSVFVFLVTIAKTLRYVALATITLGVM